jgi:23S rRNA pseudouridine1911/1915/1917 synthase
MELDVRDIEFEFSNPLFISHLFVDVMIETLQFRVGRAAAGRRLDEFLAGRLGQLSRLRIAGLLAGGACRLNERAARAGERVAFGDMVEILLDEQAPGAMTPERVPLEIKYEDEHLLVVVKPAGMLVHPTRGVKQGTLANALVYHLNRGFIEADVAAGAEAPRGESDSSVSQSQGLNLKSHEADWREMVRPGIVHRLDRATSGLMVVAKQQCALSILSRHFHQRLVRKSYLAWLRGCVREDEHLITAPIGRDPSAQPHWRVLESGRPAETRLRVLERRARSTLAELEPVTGRTNQLRIHCAHLGHAVVNDEWYAAEPAGGRLCLHAAFLGFNHPAGGRWMEFESSMPDEMAAFKD